MVDILIIFRFTQCFSLNCMHSRIDSHEESGGLLLQRMEINFRLSYSWSNIPEGGTQTNASFYCLLLIYHGLLTLIKAWGVDVFHMLKFFFNKKRVKMMFLMKKTITNIFYKRCNGLRIRSRPGICKQWVKL